MNNVLVSTLFIDSLQKGTFSMLALLRVFGVTIIAIGLLKVVLGARADQLLDASITDAAVAHPSADSQVRFYGGAFTFFGVVLWMCANDMARYEPVFQAAMVVFCAAGLARVLGAVVRGRPAVTIIGLGAIEVVIPPLLLWWQSAR